MFMNPNKILEIYDALPEKQRIMALYTGCVKALATWESYIEGKNIIYHDTIVGIKHEVENTLPREALKLVKKYILELGNGFLVELTEDIKHRYAEPVCALQDDDLEFPDVIEYAYYSIYNLFSLVFDPIFTITEHLIISQFISAQVVKNQENGIRNNDQIAQIYSQWWEDTEKMWGYV
jgi:hypothetical protein